MGTPTQVLTLAGTGQETFSEGIVTEASFNWPWKPVCLSNGDILMTDRLNNRIRRITVEQKVEVEAGSGEKSGNDGLALRASFNDPSYLFKGAGNDIYICEGHGSRLRLLSGGKVTTIAGDGTKGFRDGPCHKAQFAIVLGGCYLPTGEIYVTDNENNRVRVIDKEMMVSSIGTGTAASVDGTRETASFNQPIGLAIDPSGEVYLSERYRVRHIDRNKRVITFAGTTQGDKDGPKETAAFNNLRDLIFAPNSELLLSDSNNHKLKRIDLLGMVTTICGHKGGFKDGPLSSAMFNRPAGLCFNREGGLLISDCDNARLRIIPDMALMSQSPFSSSVDFLPLLQDCDFLDSLSETYTHSVSNSKFHVHRPFLALVFPDLLHKGLEKLVASKVSFATIQHFFTLIYSGSIPDVGYLDLIEIFYLTQVCFLPPEFSLGVRKKIFMVMGTLDVDAHVRAVYHIQTMCESLPDLVDMLVRALRPLFDASCIPKLTPLVALDESYAQKVLMGLCSPPAPPVDVKPLDLTTESYIVHRLETLYWSMLVETGVSENDIPRNFPLIKPLPAELRPDFTIRIGNESAVCHSWVLFGRWPYFRRMMESGLEETSSMEMALSDDTWSLRTLIAFLRYLYTNNMGLFDPTDEMCTELLDGARLYELVDSDSKPSPGFAPLIEYCSAPAETITISSAVSSYKRLLSFGSDAQKWRRVTFLADNIQAIMSDDHLCAEFADLGPEACASVLFASHGREFPTGSRRSSALSPTSTLQPSSASKYAATPYASSSSPSSKKRSRKSASPRQND